MTKDVKKFSVDFGGEEMTFETGRMAQQAQGAVFATHGNIAILATVGMAPNPREGIDFFPLMVDFEEKFYAAGKMKGSRFVKREGRPSDTSVLNSRLIDRPLRPLFPKGMKNDVQVICTMLQTDEKRSAVSVAMCAASMALQISGIPIEAPIAGVQVGMKEDGSFIIEPSYDEAENGKLNLIVAGTEDAIMMVEAGAQLVSNEEMLAALEFAHKEIKKICKAQKEFATQHSIEPKEPMFKEEAEAEKEAVSKHISEAELDNVAGLKHDVKDKTHALEDKLIEACEAEIEEGTLNAGKLKGELGKAIAQSMRKRVFETGKRLDGRAVDEIRPITVEVGVLPRLHGSALFQRGETQALSVATLAGPGDAKLIDTPHKAEYKKTYIHHYNFPPYSVGEVKPMRGTNRREIGHGALAERALLPMIPDTKDNFAYTMRVVSEILSCNGSSSMASVCGSTLCLMDAGVPIKRAIAGIAMGLLMKDDGKYEILTDIQGFEDFDGDMDFKVAGDEEGITALQMDIKVKGLDLNLLKQALEKAQVARQSLLKDMKAVIPEPRKEMNQHAPRIDSFYIDPEYIREVIGKGGETIQGLCADYDVSIDLEDDGLVMVTASNQENGLKVKKIIQNIAYKPQVGDVFEDAIVKNIMDFGAFVEYLPKKEALVHISEITDARVDKVTDYLKEGQKITVKLIGIDNMGRAKLTMKGLNDLKKLN